MLIELTNRNGDKFFLNSELIETVISSLGGYSEIKLTTGRSVVCSESMKTIVETVNKH